MSRKFNTAQFWLVLFTAIFTANVLSLSTRRYSWKPYTYGNCSSKYFMCLNEKCINRTLFCNGENDCGDKSDENYCNTRYCHTYYKMFSCGYKCMPEVWRCDGITDCHREDEVNCVTGVQVDGINKLSYRAERWLRALSNRNSTTDKWGIHVPRIAVALYFASPKYFSPGNATGTEIAYEISLRLLKGILRETMKVQQWLSSNKLALYTNALLVSCLNPRDFYGMDLVTRLRSQVNQQVDYVNPFLYLTLCNAGDTMTQEDIDKLYSVFLTPLHGAWTDMRSFALMALSCIAESRNGEYIPQANFTSLASDLKQNQQANGSFESLHTTALVMQALSASGETGSGKWNPTKAIDFLSKSQMSDGSFGNLLNTYYALPVLNDKSLYDINTDHCKFYSDEKTHRGHNSLRNETIPRVKVKYSIAHGDYIDVSYTIRIHVPINCSLFHVMEIASNLSLNYRFKYIIENTKPFIYELNGVQNDPEYGKFWFLHMMNETTDSDVLIDSSPADVFITDNHEFIMWYRTPRGPIKQLPALEET